MVSDAIVPLLLTLKVATLATLLASVVGIALGKWLGRRRTFTRDVAESLLTLPLVLPPSVLGYYLRIVLGHNGPIGAWMMRGFGISLIFTWQGAVVAAAVAAFPLI